MERDVLQEMHRVVEEYCAEPGLRELLTSFVQDKYEEKSTWSDITRSVHGMLGGTSPHITRAAALTEIVLLTLDIIDDLQDQDNMTKPWMNSPQPYTLNAILALMVAFIGEISGCLRSGSGGSPSPLKEMSQMLAAAVDGQQRDINGSIQTEQDYITMVQQKSGSLIRFAVYMGYSLVEDLDPEVARQLDEAAYGIGIIAQIGNDLNDLLRYDVKNDLLHKKRTLPILFLLVDSHEEFPALTQYYEGTLSREEFLLKKLECLDYVRGSGCIEYSRVIQALYKERVETLLAAVPDSDWKARFVGVTVG
jgi:competence protein ComQ